MLAAGKLVFERRVDERKNTFILFIREEHKCAPKYILFSDGAWDYIRLVEALAYHVKIW